MRGMLIAAACAVKLGGSQIGLETGVLLHATLSKQLFRIQVTSIHSCSSQRDPML
jgi:hypothetical protein